MAPVPMIATWRARHQALLLLLVLLLLAAGGAHRQWRQSGRDWLRPTLQAAGADACGCCVGLCQEWHG
jgi:hypothetical protein